jgi:hypothetical protein
MKAHGLTQSELPESGSEEAYQKSLGECELTFHKSTTWRSDSGSPAVFTVSP